MAVPAGTKLGPYVVADQLGAGGMGEVYRATDTRLERQVALKVLPDRVAGADASLARFQREAKAVSSLNHPHVCTLQARERRRHVARRRVDALHDEELGLRGDPPLSVSPTAAADWVVTAEDGRDAWLADAMDAIYVKARAATDGRERIERIPLQVEPQVRLGSPESLFDLPTNVDVEDFEGKDRFLGTIASETGDVSVVLWRGWDEGR